jgi:histone-lysine N-methyltransferase SUV39H
VFLQPILVSPPDESLPETHRVSSLFFSHIPSSQVGDLSVVQFTPARTMLEFAPRVFYSRDIPHALQDLMNSVEAPYRQSIVAKEMFEAVIYENTYEDEPSAPRISIVNDVDDDLEVTPAWEFHYSNRIWHSDGVPPPDLTNLRGCDCEGYCDPRSQTCSCLKRQQEYSGHIPGFIYDDKNRLKQRGFPIFECNDLCGCLDGCRNRVRLHQIRRDIANLFCLKVVQHGRQYAVNIRKTTNKGWGMSLNIFIFCQFKNLRYRSLCWKTKNTQGLIHWYICW